MYGQMTAGLLDLHRDPGHPPGHVRDLRRGGPPALRRVAARDRDADRRPRRHGRRAAAGRDDERRRVHRHRGRRGPGPAPPRHRLRRPADPRSRPRRWPGPATAAARGEAVSIALVGNAAEIEPAWAAAGERFDLVTDQTSAHDALGGYVPAEMTLPDALELRAALPGRVPAPRSRERWPPTSGRCSPSSGPARSSSTTATTCAPRPRRPGVADAFDYPGFVPAFIRPQFCEGRGPFRWAALSGDPADIARTDRAVLELFPDDVGPPPLDRDGPGARPVPGPAGPDLLARLRRARTGPGSRSTSWSGPARSAPRSSSAATTSTRARSPHPTARPRRCRRLGRRRRLAAPQRPREHGGRRDLGLDPPRRRRRDRLLAARRHGRRRRRHGPRGRRSWSAS